MKPLQGPSRTEPSPPDSGVPWGQGHRVVGGASLTPFWTSSPSLTRLPNLAKSQDWGPLHNAWPGPHSTSHASISTCEVTITMESEAGACVQWDLHIRAGAAQLPPYQALACVSWDCSALGEICSIVMAWALEEDFVASGEAVSARATSWLAGFLFKRGGGGFICMLFL